MNTSGARTRLSPFPVLPWKIRRSVGIPDGLPQAGVEPESPVCESIPENSPLQPADPTTVLSYTMGKPRVGKTMLIAGKNSLFCYRSVPPRPGETGIKLPKSMSALLRFGWFTQIRKKFRPGSAPVSRQGP